LMTRLAQPLDETVVFNSSPGLVEIHKLASPPSTGCAPSFATDLVVSPLPKVPLTMSASAITRTTKSFVVVGTISLSLVRALGKTSSAIAPSGFAWATLPKRMTETAGALAVVSAGGVRDHDSV